MPAQKGRGRMRRITSLLICMLFVLALAVPAFGQSPTRDAYQGLAGAGQGGSGGETVSADGGSLPFTGLELSLIALAGVGLLGAGIAVRRATRLRESRP